MIFQRLQLENVPGKGPLMYCRSTNPFDLGCSTANSVTAYQKMDHVNEGSGDGTCGSGGLRGRTIGHLDPFNFYTSLNQSVDFQRIKANLTGLRLSHFKHINVINRKKPWNITGQAGDTRLYVNGTFEMTDGDRILLSANDVKWFQNQSYPAPVGNANGDTPKIAAYFTAKINEFQSDEEWVDVVDPYDTGYMLGVVRASAKGVGNCYQSASFWITMRAFPDLGTGTYDSAFIQHNTADTGAKVGPYTGSPEKNVERAKNFGNLSLALGVTSVAVASTTSIAITAVSTVFSATAVSTITIPGNGAARMIRNSAFVARLGQIRGFHTDSFNEYASKMDVFLVKFPFPFGKKTSSSPEDRVRRRGKKKLIRAVHQADEEDANEDNGDDDDPSVSDDVFKGCAFYSMSAVAAVLLVHVFVGFWIRKRPIEEQVGPHAWMIYILSMVMEYVHTASILNAFQYFRSHLGMGTGKTLLYILAAIQFITVGFGFFLFIVIVVALALYRLQRRDVNYLPQFKHPDPDIRGSTVVTGEYQAGDDNFFHGVFEGVYSGYAGPRIWLVLIEAFIGLIDTIITAVIWDELIVLTILLSLYVFLYVIFLVLGPHVDKIEGRLVSMLTFIDLVLLFLEFLAALGNYETADAMDSLAITMGTISMAIGFIITIYCDIIPTSMTIWEWISGYVLAVLRKIRLLIPMNVESVSDWSAFSSSLATTLSGGASGINARTQQAQRRTISNEEHEEEVDQEEEEIQEQFAVPISLRASLWRRKSVQRWRRQDQDETTGDYSSSSREERGGTNYYTGVANFVRDSEAVAERIDVSERRIESVWELRALRRNSSSHTD